MLELVETDELLLTLLDELLTRLDLLDELDTIEDTFEDDDETICVDEMLDTEIEEEEDCPGSTPHTRTPP